jgi:hypothetical protein
MNEQLQRVIEMTERNTLTKRELIAAMCLQGLLAHCGHSTVTTWAASHAIDFADALLAELAKEQS